MLVASFQDCVLIDVAMQVAPKIEVVFLDTQYHFAETLWYVEQVKERYGLNLRVIEPIIPPDNLWQNDPDSCCEMRKVEPLARVLSRARRHGSPGCAATKPRPAPTRPS